MKPFFTILLLSLLSMGAFAQHTNRAMVKPSDIFRPVELPPEPRYDLMAYIGKHMVYPNEARKAKIEGDVVVKFVVNKDGSISDVAIAEGQKLGYGLPEEALRLVTSFPDWKPGMQNGMTVLCYVTLPITFKLP